MAAMLPGRDTNGGVDYDPFAEGTLTRVVPTTEPQREVWLADRLGCDASLAFNESVSLRLKGRVDAAALQEAVQALVDRHDALRANFGPDGETLCVLERRAVPFETIDLASQDPLAREAALAERLRLAVETPFALEHDALFRAELLLLAPDDHQLVLTAHHIVCDGWSWWVLVQELSVLYRGHCGAGAAALPDVDGFADYALGEALYPDGPDFAADEAYWLEQFADEIPVLDLQTDRPRPSRRSFASVREDHVIPAATVVALRRTSASHGASLFAMLLGSFAATLSRLAGQPQVVVGIPAAGQLIGGHNSLVGHCVNTLPLRFELDMAQPASAMIDAAQATLLDAIEHQRYTFGTLLKKLPIARDPSRLPLVSVLFNIDQALDHESVAFPGLTLEFSSNPRSFENFELFINAVEVHGELRLECQYNRDLFDLQTVRRWLAAYETLLSALARNPQQTLGALPLVAEMELQQLQALQPTPVRFEREFGVHELFERQCGLTPERIALRCAEDAFTYADLEARANRIAHLLRSHGVHRGALVGLAVDRGGDMLAGLLGILKSGAGYVPLDPGFPTERLAYMAGDAGLAALITQSAHAGNFDLRGRPVLALDELGPALAGQSAMRLPRDEQAACEESVAYVIYTSGSTGRPKGVQVPHRAVVNFLESMQREPGMGAADILVAVTTLSFDIAVLELLLPLSVGAQVVLADRQTAMDGGALAALLADSAATVMQATPATWRMLVEAGWSSGDRFKMLCGGEPLPADLAAVLLAGHGELWNLYGPTETTVWSTCARILPAVDGTAVDVHIGRPIANTSTWILDERGEPCPRGIPGEICIGGFGVTLGYLERPELTAERFVADRFCHAEAGEAPMLYRTGDRGRWRADGNLQHLGRIDFQVKIRGYRIELGEIESMLAAHPAVAQTVALAREDRPGDVRLVAYVVAAPGAAIDEAAVLDYLRQTLPDYMVPQHLMVIKAMPRLPNGKLDRKALPAPNIAGRVAAERAQPRNVTEQSIAKAMAEVLGMQEIGIHDDFFAIGGHSLLAAKLTMCLSQEFGTTLSLRTLFDAPTVARLASLMSSGSAQATPARDPIHRRDDQRFAPLTPLQDRMRMVEAFNPGNVAYNTPSAHRLVGPLDVAMLDRAFRCLVRRHTVLRTSITEEDGVAVQRIHDDIDTGLPVVEDLVALPPEQREDEALRRMREMIDTPFGDLSVAPLFRVRLYRVDEQCHLLFFMPHHIIWDGWSFDLLYSDLAEIYAALLEGRAPHLPELPVSYGDYAAWQREWMQGPEYVAQLAFWKNSLGGARRLDALPSDLPRKRGQQAVSRSIQIKLDRETSQRLHDISGRLGVTVFTTLLAAWYAVLARMAGQQDIVVGTLVRGRNSFEVENLMGCFTNLLPLRMRLDFDTTFSRMAHCARNLLLDGLANPDLQLEDLPVEFSLHNEGGAAMFYHAQFSFQDVRHRTTKWGPLKHERIEVFQPGASEDIALLIVEGEGGMAGSLVYNSTLFHERTIGRMRDRFQELLRRVAIDPGQTLSTLLAFNDAEVGGHDIIAGLDRAVDDFPSVERKQSSKDERVPTASIVKVSPRETYLLELWSEVLGTVALPSDNFFDIGGNSMLAMQMAERVAKRTGYRIKLMQLAVQSAAEIAAGLPSEVAPGSRSSGGWLASRVMRLFGASPTGD